MVRHYKNSLIYSNKSIVWQIWMLIGIIIIYGLVNVNAEQKCCYSTKSALQTGPNLYQLNVTASHVDSRKGNNVYVTAISFPKGYLITAPPFSPFSKVVCTQAQPSGTGTRTEELTQYECDSRDRATFFVVFDLSIQPVPQTNSTIAPASVFIFGDKCQNVAFCTDLAEKKESENSDKISLGPLGTWPKYAIVIGGVVLGISLLAACYLVYKRNRPGDRYRDTTITPSPNHYDDKDQNRALFVPNSLLRSDEGDTPPPSIEPPKNTLIKFGSVTAHSPERSNGARIMHLPNQQSSSLTKSSTTKMKKDKRDKKDKNHQEIHIYDNAKSDDGINGDDKFALPMPVSTVIIDMPSHIAHSGRRSLDKSSSIYHKTRKSGDNNTLSTHRISDYSTSDMSKTISNNDESEDETSDDNKNFYSSKRSSSTSVNHKKSRSKPRNGEHDSRRERKLSNNHNSASHRRGGEEDREGRRIDRGPSKRHRSRSSPPPPASKTTDLHRGSSTRARQTDRERDRGDHREEKHSNNDSISKNKGSSVGVHRSKTTPSNQTHQSDRGAGKRNKNSTPLANLNRSSSSRHKPIDLISHADTESTTSSSDVPLGDRLPLAMLAKLPPSGQSNSWKPTELNVINYEDDDTTPLGRISSSKTDSFCAASTSSHTRLLSTDKSLSEKVEYGMDDKYESVLDEVLGIADYLNSEKGSSYKGSEDNYPIGKTFLQRKEK
ncbi:7473_t:CDS:2 [Funneliformis caledonium]|uniref:7473_t:CDS:1 n=1 Tax=Funneliformis caledonium TaxID=1117310 RepID=A0A9N9BQ02_9GLOM|nr:7473_t:CDS:2 [Funneliformis caledonium]